MNRKKNNPPEKSIQEKSASEILTIDREAVVRILDYFEGSPEGPSSFRLWVESGIDRYGFQAFLRSYVLFAPDLDWNDPTSCFVFMDQVTMACNDTTGSPETVVSGPVRAGHE